MNVIKTYLSLEFLLSTTFIDSLIRQNNKMTNIQLRHSRRPAVLGRVNIIVLLTHYYLELQSMISKLHFERSEYQSIPIVLKNY